MIFPPAIVWYTEKIIAKKVDDEGRPIVDQFGNEQYKCPNCICWRKCLKKKVEYDEQGHKLAKLGIIERTFDTHINNFVGHKIGKFVIIGVSLIWFIACIIMTTQIEPLSKQEEMIDPEHPAMKTFTLMNNEFTDREAGTGRKAHVRMMWGGSDLSKDLVPAWNVSMKGNVTFDDSFAVNFHK
jgi:hypothetical protein